MKSIAFDTILRPPGPEPTLLSPVELALILPGFAPAVSPLLHAPAPRPSASAENYLLIPDHSDLRRTRRLVVLVPEEPLDESALARRIWELASPGGLPVHFISLAPSAESLPAVRRRLALMAAQSSGELVKATIEILNGQDWRRLVQATFRPGDLLVCLAGHHVSARGIGRTPLGEMVSQALEVPVVMIAGITVAAARPQWARLRTLLAWMSSIAFLVAFTTLQSLTARRWEGPLATFTLCASVAVEIVILLKINQWIG